MSKIVSMSSGAIDPINVTKRVFWTPVTTTTILKVGQPVCYNSDSVLDHKARSVDPTHLGLTIDTYAQGEQEFTGRLFVTEEPLTDNLNAFAGIVKSLGPKAGAIGDMIEIFTPVEGVMVPVLTDQNCVEERTIMGIRNGAGTDVSYPGRPIGVAQETKDRSTNDGMVWMKFRNFEYDATNAAGDATLNSLIVDDEAGANAVTIKAMNVRFDGTGRARGLYYVGEINGAGHCAYGMFKFRTYVGAALSQNAHTLCANLHLRDDCTLIDTPEYANSPLYLSIETETTGLTLSGGSIAAIYIAYYVESSGAAPASVFIMQVNTNQGTANYEGFDGLIKCNAADDIGGYVSPSGPDIHQTAGSIMVPIRIGGTTYYLVACVDDGAD